MLPNEYKHKMPHDDDSLILLVDDNISNLKVLGAVLSSRGYRVALASNGEECLEFVEKQLPDLIFLDIMMPGLNGFDVCKRLKSNPKAKSIPVIFISALANSQHITKAFESGGIDYLVKPFDKNDLLARTKVHLGIKKEMDTLRTTVIDLEEKIKQMQD